MKSKLGYEEYTRQQAEYMKQHRVHRKHWWKQDRNQREHSKARRARRELQAAVTAEANKAANRLVEMGKQHKTEFNR
jgi:hypothetical protein